MKRLLSIILTISVLSNCSDKPSDISRSAKSGDATPPDTIKVFYKNDSINIWSVNSEKDPYPDTAIFFTFPENLFPFPGEKRVVNIYYDKAFKSLAVTMLLNKSDTSYHYKRFDHKGNLRMEIARQNGKIVGDEFSWYSNGKFRAKWNYKNQKRIADTTYYWTGHLKKTSIYVKSLLFKETEYYADGNVSSECFWEIPQNKDPDDYAGNLPKFSIEYDSTSRLPKLFYVSTREEVTTDKEGNEITTMIFTHTPVDSATIKTKSK